MLANHATRCTGDSVSLLHQRLFSNYVEWCAHLNVRPRTRGVAIDAATTEAKVEECALWLCVWGEAANLRVSH